MKNLIVVVAVVAGCGVGFAYAQSGNGSSPVGRYQMAGDGWRLDTATGSVWRCDVKNGRCVKYQVE